MKRKTILIIVAALIIIFGYYRFVNPIQYAKNVNEYDENEITIIEITDMKTDRTIQIEDEKKIKVLIGILKSDYKIKRIEKEREQAIFANNALEYTVAFYNNAQIMEIYQITLFNTLIIVETKSLEGQERTKTFESLEEQENRINGLKAIFKECD